MNAELSWSSDKVQQSMTGMLVFFSSSVVWILFYAMLCFMVNTSVLVNIIFNGGFTVILNRITPVSKTVELWALRL